MGIVIGIASILVSGILCTTYISPEAEQMQRTRLSGVQQL